MRGVGSAAPLAALLAALGASPLTARAADPASLRGAISLRFPGVAWVSTAELASWLARREGEAQRPVLLDARSAAEYEVSHLGGARRVDPGADAPLPTDLPEDAPVVVYCSVGYRSAALAHRLQAKGLRRVYNLEGGIFQWANEGRPVYREGEPVREVHPYGRLWGRFLDEDLRASP
jgi:rhodanese-related sulfurtransferase